MSGLVSARPDRKVIAKESRNYQISGVWPQTLYEDVKAAKEKYHYKSCNDLIIEAVEAYLLKLDGKE